tara:strand:- start:74 stop:2311 length:2238 start_codon:yes stop_codon:yes gene_type:complete
MAKLTQEDIELFNFIINDPQSTDSEKKSAQDVLSQFGDSKESTPKKVATKKVAPKKATPKTDNKQISDLEAKKMQLLRDSGKTEEECEEIIEQYRALKSEKKTQTKKETVQKEKAKKRTTKLKKEGKTIKGTTEKNIEATLDTVTEKVVKKIDKEVDKIEKTSTTKKQVEKKISSLVSKAVKSNKKLLSDTAKELAKVDKNNAKAYLMSLRKEIDSLLTKYEYGGTIPTPFGQAGLVGETGTMNEVDLFAMGGGLPQGVHQYYAQTYNPAYPTPHGYAEGGEIPMTKLKKYKSLIEKHKAFNKFYEDTGEDYDYALEMWIPKYYELVDVYSEQEKDNLIKALNKLNSTYAKGGKLKPIGTYSVLALVDGFDEAKQDYDQVYYKTDDYVDIIYYIADLKNEGEYTKDMQLIEVMPNGKMRKFNSSMLAKGGKTQGYNDKLDESLGMRDGFEPMMMQSYKDRRDESKGMEKSMGRRAYKSVGTMDKMAKGGSLDKYMVWVGGVIEAENISKFDAEFIAMELEGDGYDDVAIQQMAKGGETSSKTSNIKAELSKLQSEVTDRPPTVFERDGELFVSSEEGDEFSDYYGEYYEPQYVDERLEAIASKYGGYWDWENSGTLIFVDESYAKGGKTVDVMSIKSKDVKSYENTPSTKSLGIYTAVITLKSGEKISVNQKNDPFNLVEIIKLPNGDRKYIRANGEETMRTRKEIDEMAKGGKTKRSKHSYMQDRRRISSQPWEVAYQKKKDSK